MGIQAVPTASLITRLAVSSAQWVVLVLAVLLVLMVVLIVVVAVAVKKAAAEVWIVALAAV